VTSIPKAMAVAKKELDSGEFIPYESHPTRQMVKLKSGDYAQVLRLQGAAHESADVGDINSWHDELNNFLRNLASPNMALWSHVVRREYKDYPEGDLPDGFSKDLDSKYRATFESERLMVNELYVTIIYRPIPVAAARWLSKIGGKRLVDPAAQQSDEIDQMRERTNAALSSLKRYEPEVLGIYEHNGHCFTEILEFFAFLINGEWNRVPLPKGNLSKALAVGRPFIGREAIEMRGPSSSRVAAMMGIKDYPAVTCPGILNDLISMPFELVISQSFTFMTTQSALGMMKRQQDRLINAGDVAQSQVEELTLAMDDVKSGRYVMGFHNFGLLIKAQNIKELSDNIADVRASLSDNAIVSAREDLGLSASFYAQLPGNFTLRPRPAPITSRNFAGFSCFHNYPVGRIKNNQWGPALTMFKTTSGAPYYFNWHQATGKGAVDPNHKENGSGTVIGPPGTGKSALQNFMISQSQKFNRPDINRPMTGVLFDKDEGSLPAVNAMNGKYFSLKNGVPSGFNYLQLEPTPNNLTFIERMVRCQVRRDGMPLTPAQEKEIELGIEGIMDSPIHLRRPSALLEFFDPTDENGLHARYARWCRGGALGWLFDNPEDTLLLNDRAPIYGFDITDFLENDETRTPTIMYLFHRVNELIDGRRISIHFDEAWKAIQDDEIGKQIDDFLVTIRKKDGHIVLYTQAPKQVMKSKYADSIIGGTPTKIFLPNPQADMKDYVEGFKCTQREWEIIKSLGVHSRRFLIKQGENSVVAELNLRGFDDELAVLSGNTVTSALAKSLVSKYNGDVNKWLPEFQRVRKGV